MRRHPDVVGRAPAHARVLQEDREGARRTSLQGAQHRHGTPPRGDGDVRIGRHQPAQVLRHATSEGAAILGFDRVGELREGWRADVILLRADDLNMAPINVLDGQVVLAAQPSNVDTVFIDGVLRKQHGELIGLDPKALVRDATRAVEALKERVGSPLA